MTGVVDALRAAAAVAARSIASGPAAELADVLYSSWYAAPLAEPLPEGPEDPPSAGMLSAEAMLVGRVVPAVVRRVDPAGGSVVRRRGGGHQVVLPGGWVRPTGDPRSGLPLRESDEVLVPDLGGPLVAQGWWRSWSPDWSHPAPRVGLTRLYLCPAPADLVEAVGLALATLREVGGPWLLKCAVTAQGQVRPDRVVVYLPDGRATAGLTGLATALGGMLDAHHPPLAAPWSTGISWAQDDGDGASFGENRCAALAATLGPWARAGAAGDGLEEACLGLRAAGLDDQHPHLRRTVATA